MRRQEFIVNLLLMAASLFCIAYVIPVWSPEPEDLGLAPATLPTLLCGLVFVLALLQAIKGWRLGIDWGARGVPISKGVVVHLIRYFAVMLCIFPAWSYLGFLGGSVVVLFLLYAVTGIRNKVVTGLICVGLPVVCYLLLQYGLRIPTP